MAVVAFFKNGVEIPNSRFAINIVDVCQLSGICTVPLNIGDIVTVRNVDSTPASLFIDVPPGGTNAATININKVG